MHHELERLSRDFGWSNPLVANTQVPMLFQPANAMELSSAYSDSHMLERAELDENSWWYQTRNQIIVQALKRLSIPSGIWDIGSGTGVVASAMMSTGRQVICIEPSAAGANITANVGIPTFASTLEQLQLPSNSIHVVSLFDVLEHVEHRHELLHEIMRVLKPRGRLILTVPALPFLWSQFDEDEAHQIRYSKSTLRHELEQHGFEIVENGFFFALTVLPLLLLRTLPYRLGIKRELSDSAAVSAGGGPLAILLMRLERLLSMRTPIGSSILAIVQKPGSGEESGNQ